MDIRKTILYVAVAVLGVVLLHAWQHDYPSANNTETTQVSQTQDPQHPAEFAPGAYQSNATHYEASPQKLSNSIPIDKNITVTTNVLSATINLVGGDLVDAKLLQYPVSLQDKNTPVQILNSDENHLYLAQSGLSAVSQSAQKNSARKIIFQSSQTTYNLKDDQNTLTVTLNGKTENNIAVQKIYIFKRSQYAVSSAIYLKNNSNSEWRGSIYNQITHRYMPVKGYNSRAYNGAAVSTENTPYKKLSFESLSESDFSRDIVNGWVAMQQHYFLSAWIPAKNQNFHYYSRSFGNGDDGKGNIFILGYVSPIIRLAPGESVNVQSTFYTGPEIANNLQELGRGLDHTVDYGWLWPISKFLFWLLSEVDHYVGNWGWSIVLVTIMIKVAFYWFSNKSYISMAKMRDFQPRIQALKERYGDDKPAMSKAMMELYRKEKMNPLGGCLPMIIQIPIFLALYYVLVESVELRQAPFVFWIHDLATKDPYFILPILMGFSMFVQQKISPPPPDPMQAKMMMLLPLVFTVFFATFPAGLVLYWLTNNCASILQQWFVMKMHEKRKKTEKTKKIAKR